MYFDPSGYSGYLNCVSVKFAEPLDDNALVVRGGTSTPENLQINQSKDERGHISANSGNGATIGELATSPEPFLNGKITITTVGEIRDIGMDVVPDPTAKNPLRASIIPTSVPITDSEVSALSSLFNQQKNEWKK